MDAAHSATRTLRGSSRPDPVGSGVKVMEASASLASPSTIWMRRIRDSSPPGLVAPRSRRVCRPRRGLQVILCCPTARPSGQRRAPAGHAEPGVQTHGESCPPAARLAWGIAPIFGGIPAPEASASAATLPCGATPPRSAVHQAPQGSVRNRAEKHGFLCLSGHARHRASRLYPRQKQQLLPSPFSAARPAGQRWQAP